MDARVEPAHDESEFVALDATYFKSASFAFSA
jgi:hypothetical protein